MSSTYSTTASSLWASGASMSYAFTFFGMEISPSESCVQIKSYSDIRRMKWKEKNILSLNSACVHTLLQAARNELMVGVRTLLAIFWPPGTSVFFFSESELIVMTSGLSFFSSFSLIAFPFLPDATNGGFWLFAGAGRPLIRLPTSASARRLLAATWGTAFRQFSAATTTCFWRFARAGRPLIRLPTSASALRLLATARSGTVCLLLMSLAASDQVEISKDEHKKWMSRKNHISKIALGKRQHHYFSAMKWQYEGKYMKSCKKRKTKKSLLFSIYNDSPPVHHHTSCIETVERDPHPVCMHTPRSSTKVLHYSTPRLKSTRRNLV